MSNSNSATVQLLGLGKTLAARAAVNIDAFADAIAGTVPDANACRTLLMAGDNGVAVYVRAASGLWQGIVQVAALDDASLPVLSQHMRGLPAGPMLLRVGAGRAVLNRLSLPAAAAEVLPAVVRNKVESLAPWPLSEALWGYRTADSTENGQIAVDVGIVSRKTAFGLIAALERAGARIGRLEIGGNDDVDDGIEIDVHGEERRGAARRRITTVMSAAAALALLVGATGSFLAFQTQSAFTEAEEQIARLQQSLRGNGDAAASPRLAEANKLYHRKIESRPAVEVLNTLTGLVPDSIWLSTLELDSGKLTIAGRGNQVPGVIETLESSDTFRDVNFASATQREPDAAADSFAISALVEVKEPQP